MVFFGMLQQPIARVLWYTMFDYASPIGFRRFWHPEKRAADVELEKAVAGAAHFVSSFRIVADRINAIDGRRGPPLLLSAARADV